MKALEKPYDAIARGRDAARKHQRAWLSFFLPFLKKSWVVLDAGCGNANNAVEIARRAKRSQYCSTCGLAASETRRLRK